MEQGKRAKPPIDNLRPFGLSIEDPSGDVITVKLTGELDLMTAPELERVAKRLIGRAPVVVLDLAGISFIDSSGVRALIRLRNALAECEADLRLRSPAPQVRRVLRVCGADTLFPELAKTRQANRPS